MSRALRGLLLLLSWAAATPLHAGAPTVDGSLRYDLYGYPDRDSRGDEVENFVEAIVRLRGRASVDVSYRFEGRAVADDADFTAGGFDVRQSELRRPYLDLPEAVVDWTPTSGLRVSLGRQIVNWSTIDEFQPANLLSPLDESDIFRRVPLGAFGAAAHYERGPVAADLVVVPLAFQMNRLPQGRWRFVPDGVGLQLHTPPVQLDETQAGVRIGTRFDSLEVALLGYVGRDMFPLFTLDRPPSENAPNPEVGARYTRTRAGGIVASMPVADSILLRSECVYYSSPDERREEFFQWVPLGIEYTRGDWRLVFNYLRYDRTAKGTGALNQGERRFYRSFVFGEGSYEAGGRLRARVRAGYDTEGEFFLFEPDVSYRLWRELRLSLVADVVQAHPTSSFSYFDLIRHEDRVGLRAQYFF